MQYQSFNVEIKDNVAHVEFCRPKALNTLLAEFWPETEALCNELNACSDVGAVIISSTGPVFSAGLDFSVFDRLLANDGFDKARTVERDLRLIYQLQRAFTLIAQLRVPVLVGVQGACLGGGVDLAAACDMRYCTEDATFCIQEINIGVAADAGSLQRLPQIMPMGLVKELAYTGRKLTAEEAKDCGFVNRVYADQEAMLTDLKNIAAQITAKSPLAVMGSKKVLDYSVNRPLDQSLEYMALWQAGFGCMEDVQESIMAMKSKRQPEYKKLYPGAVKLA